MKMGNMVAGETSTCQIQFFPRTRQPFVFGKENKSCFFCSRKSLPLRVDNEQLFRTAGNIVDEKRYKLCAGNAEITRNLPLMLK